MKNKTMLLMAFFLLSLTGLQSQETVLTTGGNASGSGGSASYSIGQVLYTNIVGATGSVEHGIQQPFEISTFVGIDDNLGISLSLSVYPNPTTDFLNLKVENEDYKNLSYQLYDINGRQLLNEKMIDNNTNIKMSHLQKDIYYLIIMDNHKLVKVFKIIKN